MDHGSLNRGGQLLVYWATAIDAVVAIIRNDYESPTVFPAIPDRMGTTPGMPAVYSRLFYFARLRPRLLFSIGALLRALQLATPFQRIINPSAGVGAGINMCAMAARSRWVSPLVVGWASTREAWLFLGAKPPSGVHVPISVQIGGRSSATHQRQPQQPQGWSLRSSSAKGRAGAVVEQATWRGGSRLR